MDSMDRCVCYRLVGRRQIRQTTALASTTGPAAAAGCQREGNRTPTSYWLVRSELKKNGALHSPPRPPTNPQRDRREGIVVHAATPGARAFPTPTSSATHLHGMITQKLPEAGSDAMPGLMPSMRRRVGNIFPTPGGMFGCRDNMPAANRFPPDGADGSFPVPCACVFSLPSRSSLMFLFSRSARV